MTINERIIRAVTPVVPACVPDIYRPGPDETAAEVYCTFNHSVLGGLFADDMPAYDRYLVQVHLFAPHGRNILETRQEIKRRLFMADFTWPEETDAGAGRTDNSESQHIVFECEIAEGVSPDG